MKKLSQVLTLGTLGLFAQGAVAATLDIKITNLTQGIHFTPIIVTAHNDDAHIFQSGVAASTQLQTMAEGGDISPLATLLGTINADVEQNPAMGLLAPGAYTMITDFMTSDDNTVLSLAAMLLPTNDGFVGIDSWKIPAEAGTYTVYLNGYDAGTEANDEIVNGGGALGVAGIPAAPGMDSGTGGTGVTTTEATQVVHIHRGVLGDTDPNGGTSDLDSTVHRWLNPVAKLTVTVK